MDEEIVQGVIETIDCANQHRLHLAELIASLDEAKNQVKLNEAKGLSIIIIIYAYNNFYRKREGGGLKMMISIITIYSDAYMLYDLSR